MALRVGFDLDGVLADMEMALIREAEKLFGHDLTRSKSQEKRAAPASMSDLVPEEISDDAPLRNELRLTARQRRQLWRHVSAINGFWKSLDEIEPGCVARLAAVAMKGLWEVVFLTRHPQTVGATAQVQSQALAGSQGVSSTERVRSHDFARPHSVGAVARHRHRRYAGELYRCGFRFDGAHHRDLS